MSLGHGTSAVRSGLVFHYDTSNTQKSWKGKPTSNLATDTPLESGWYGSYSVVDSSTKTFSITTLQPSVATNSAWRTWYWSVSSYIGSYITITADVEFVSQTAATFSNISIGQGNTGAFPVHITGSDPADRVTITTIPTSKIHMTWSGIINSTGIVGICLWINNVIADNGSCTLKISNVQIEAGSFATPFVNGSRSNSQSILDLTKNNVVTATSLTYTSNNTFSFNGSGNVIDVASMPYQLLTTGFTASVVFKYTQTTANDNLISWGNSAFNNTSYAWEIRIRGGAGTNVEFSPGVGPGGTGTPSRLQYNQGTNPLSGRVAVIDVTMVANGIASIYENGVLKNSLDYSGIGTYTTINSLAIGRGTDSYFPGDIYSTKIYNRALTAAEITQNFEALRGRYGI